MLSNSCSRVLKKFLGTELQFIRHETRVFPRMNCSFLGRYFLRDDVQFLQYTLILPEKYRKKSKYLCHK